MRKHRLSAVLKKFFLLVGVGGRSQQEVKYQKILILSITYKQQPIIIWQYLIPLD